MPEITNYCIDDKCSRCGSCCTDFAYISDAEISKIKRYLKKHPVKEEHDKPDFTGRIPMLCPFHNAIERKCNIYEVRPKVCREFQCNKSIEEIEAIKQKFTARKYHNSIDLLSWHKVFFNNTLQEDAFIGNK